MAPQGCTDRLTTLVRIAQSLAHLLNPVTLTSHATIRATRIYSANNLYTNLTADELFCHRRRPVSISLGPPSATSYRWPFKEPISNSKFDGIGHGLPQAIFAFMVLFASFASSNTSADMVNDLYMFQKSPPGFRGRVVTAFALPAAVSGIIPNIYSLLLVEIAFSANRALRQL